MFYRKGRYILILVILIILFSGCEKEKEVKNTTKYNTVNQAEDMSISLVDFFFYPKTEVIWLQLQYDGEQTYFYKEPFLLEQLVNDQWFEVAPKEGIVLRPRKIQLEGTKESVGILLYKLYGPLPEGLYRFIILMGKAEEGQKEEWYPMSIEFTIQ